LPQPVKKCNAQKVAAKKRNPPFCRPRIEETFPHATTEQAKSPTFIDCAINRGVKPEIGRRQSGWQATCEIHPSEKDDGFRRAFKTK